MVGGAWRVLRGALEAGQRRALEKLYVVLLFWARCSPMALQQIDCIIELLNAGDLGRLVTCCRYLRGRRPISRLRVRALHRCARILYRAQRMLSEEWGDDSDSSGAASEQVDQG